MSDEGFVIIGILVVIVVLALYLSGNVLQGVILSAWMSLSTYVRWELNK